MPISLFLSCLLWCAVAAQDCSFHSSCDVCQKFTCSWCMAGTLSVGCFPTGMCPGVSSGTSQCPLTRDTCPFVQDCSVCIMRQDCHWCDGGSPGTTYGCVSKASSCPGNSYSRSWCKGHDKMGRIIASVCSGASFGLGIMIGVGVFYAAYHADIGTQQKKALMLFLVSFVLWGAALFSFLLSVKVARKSSRRFCHGRLFFIFVLGFFELGCVVSGLLTSLIMEQNENFYYGDTVGGVITMSLSLPTVVGGLLCFGGIRLSISSCAARKKTKSKDDDSSDSEESEQENNLLQQREARQPFGPVGTIPVGAPILYQQQQRPEDVK